MRCRQARNRLTESGKARRDRPLDRELLEHLLNCPACARQAEAARELRQAFTDGRVHDHVDTVAWLELKRRVESAVAFAHQKQPKENSLMSTLRSQLKRRPRLSLGVAAAAIALLAVTLIPFRLDRTVGFEVAVAGVDREVAFDTDKINQLLEGLGVGNATVDVTGCEATCNLMISELQSEGDAQLVAAAFDELGRSQVCVDVNVVRELTSGSALEHARNVYAVISNSMSSMSDDEVQEVLEGRLTDELRACNVIVLKELSGDGEQKIEIIRNGVDGGYGELTWVGEDGIASADPSLMANVMLAKTGQDCNLIVGSDVGTGGEKKICITKCIDGDSANCIIQPEMIVNGQLTDEARTALEAQGYEVEETQESDGVLVIKLTRNTGAEEEVMIIKIMTAGDDTVGKESEEAELPEGYQLSQNYPNPFNPTTLIDYSVAQAQHVTIDVFNINGQKVRTLVDEMVGPGEYTVEWDATSDSGERLASGVYLYRFAAGELVQTRKMTLLK